MVNDFMFLIHNFCFQNCSEERTTQDALHTVPSHYDTLNVWAHNAKLIEQH